MFQKARVAGAERTVLAVTKVAAIVLIARSLGAAGLGEFSFGITAIAVGTTLTSYGMSLTAAYYAAREGGGDEGGRWLRGSLTIGLAGGLMGATAILLFAHFTQILDLLSPMSSVVVAVGLICNNLFVIVGAWCHGRGRFVLHLWGVVLQQSVFFAFLGGRLLRGNLEPATALFAWVLGLAVVTILWTSILLREVGGAARGRTRSASLHALLAYGTGAYAYNIGQQVAMRGDSLLVGIMLGAEPLGWYSVARNACELVLYLAYLLGPVFMERAGREGPYGPRPFAAASFALAFSLSVLVVLAPFAIPVVLGAEFIRSVGPTMTLAIGSYGVGIGIICAHYLMGLQITLYPAASSLTLALAVCTVTWGVVSAGTARSATLVAGSVGLAYLIYGLAMVRRSAMVGGLRARDLVVPDMVTIGDLFGAWRGGRMLPGADQARRAYKGSSDDTFLTS